MDIELPECFGTILPDPNDAIPNQWAIGKAIKAKRPSRGIVTNNPELSVDLNELSACLGCKAYRYCYDLCVAKLLLHNALI